MALQNVTALPRRSRPTRPPRGTASILKCPRCWVNDVSVFDSRITPNNSVRRRRGCLACGHRWTTVEVDAEVAKKLHDLGVTKETLIAYGRMLIAIADELPDFLKVGESP